MAELWGVLEGLKLTTEYGMRRVVIIADSMEAGHAIEKGSTKNGEGVALIKKDSKFNWYA